MRVLFATYPSVAHFWPFVPLAWAFQSAGHEVRIASHAGFAGTIAAAGLTPVALGDPHAPDARTRDDAPQPRSPEEVLRYADVLGLDAKTREQWIVFYQYLLNPTADYLRLDLPEAGELVEFARAWRPDLVLWDWNFACAPVAARACGAAQARVLLSPDCFAWSLDRLAEHRDELRAAGLPENPLADLVRPLAQRYGVEVDDELLVGQWTVDPLPMGLGMPTSVKTSYLRYVPYTGAEAFPSWLYKRPDRPRVALSLGESTRRFIAGDWDRAPKIMEAVANLDVEVIATLNELQLQGIGRIPDNVRILEWVPLTQLLPTCSAIVHHGGGGSFAASCAYRVPQVVCDTDESYLMRQEKPEPGTADTGVYQRGREFGVREETTVEAARWVVPGKHIAGGNVSSYVVRHGAGVRLNHQVQTVDQISKQILQVLTDPRYQDGANDIYDRWLATPSPADVVATLEQLTARHR